MGQWGACAKYGYARWDSCAIAIAVAGGYATCENDIGIDEPMVAGGTTAAGGMTAGANWNSEMGASGSCWWSLIVGGGDHGRFDQTARATIGSFACVVGPYPAAANTLLPVCTRE